jgi:L-fuculose-phosphate aldolase
MEKYTGVKFEVRALPGHVEGAGGLLEADRLVARFVRTEGGDGNLSVRKGSGFLIKRTGAQMTKLREEDVVFVQKVDGGTVHAIGGTPSSESRMHHAIYRARNDANVILHFHDDKRLAEKSGAGMPGVWCSGAFLGSSSAMATRWTEIGPFPYGTAELADAAGTASLGSDLIKIRKHGFVVIAKDLKGLAAALSTL